MAMLGRLSRNDIISEIYLKCKTFLHYQVYNNQWSQNGLKTELLLLACIFCSGGLENVAGIIKNYEFRLFCREKLKYCAFFHENVVDALRAAGLHKLWCPVVRDRSTWSKFGAHGEYGDVFLFSNLGAL